MITQFLLNFMNAKSNAQTKLQMMDAMSKILDFSNDERTMLGLKPHDKVFLTPPTSTSTTQNLADKLVNFLLIDDEWSLFHVLK